MTLLTLDRMTRPEGMARTTVRVIDKQLEADEVVSLLLEDPTGCRLPDWSPGAHVDLILPNGAVRQYSLCGDRWDPYRYRVAVLREPNGHGGSAYIHDDLQVGDALGLGGPRNNFHLVPSPGYIFAAGGIGITPLLPMINTADRVGADWTLLYGARSRSHMAFADELAERFGKRVQLVPQDRCGLLDLDTLREPAPGTAVYTCGPPPLLDAVARATVAWPPHKVRMERFTPKERGAPVLDEPFTVSLARTGTEIRVLPGQTVLDAVRGTGSHVLTSCEQGTCGTCETTVLEGVPDHRDSIYDDAERAACDRMFICVSRSCTSRLVLDL